MHGTRLGKPQSTALRADRARMSLAKHQGVKQGVDMLYETRWQAFRAFRYSPLSRRQESSSPLSATLCHLYPLHGNVAARKNLLLVMSHRSAYLYLQCCACIHTSAPSACMSTFESIRASV